MIGIKFWFLEERHCLLLIEEVAESALEDMITILEACISSKVEEQMVMDDDSEDNKEYGDVHENGDSTQDKRMEVNKSKKIKELSREIQVWGTFL